MDEREKEWAESEKGRNGHITARFALRGLFSSPVERILAICLMIVCLGLTASGVIIAYAYAQKIRASGPPTASPNAIPLGGDSLRR
jgi:hypothetical protein